MEHIRLPLDCCLDGKVQAGGLTKAAQIPEFGLWCWVSLARDTALPPRLVTGPVQFWSVQGVTVLIAGVLARVLGLRHLRSGIKAKSKESFTHVLGFFSRKPFLSPMSGQAGDCIMLQMFQLCC